MTQPFAGVGEAWFWYVDCQPAEFENAPIIANAGEVTRPCEPADIRQVLLRFRCVGRLRARHLRVLAYYSYRIMPPDPQRPARGDDLRPGREALARLEPPLRQKGIGA